MLENNSNRLIFGAIAIVTAGAIYGTVNAAYPDATNQIIKKIQAPFVESNKTNSNKISVVDDKQVNMTINVPYSKLPNGKYISGANASVDFGGKNYKVPSTNDFDTFYNKYTDYFDGGNGITLSNGLQLDAYGMTEAYDFSSEFGKKSFVDDANQPWLNPIGGESVLKASTGNIETSSDDSNQSVDLQAQSVEAATIMHQDESYSEPQDYDVSLQKTYSLDTSENNLNLAKKLYQNFDFDSKQLYFVNQGSNLHVHYYEVDPDTSNN